MKKVLLSFVAVAAAVALAPMFAAFEAHVVNVTARIENALSVSAKALDFGTVFPQEHLKQPLSIELSGSFMKEDRVDDVNYFIRQKPKCGLTTDDGKNLVAGSTTTGHLIVGTAPQGEPGQYTQYEEGYYVDCGLPPRFDVAGADWGVLPSLCPYISKEGPDANDDTTLSFHQPWKLVGDGTPVIEYLDTSGRLAKSENDIEDTWTIDLAVPCFGGYCAQDWLSYVRRITDNPSMTLEEANAYTQPIGNEHKIFGCDLWVEVGGVSERPVAQIDPNTTWSFVDLDQSGGGAGKEWFAKARNNNANFEVALGVNDALPAGQDTDEATWTANTDIPFTLTYDGAGNAAFTAGGVTTNYVVGNPDTYGRIGVNAKAPNGQTTIIDNLVLSTVAPLTTDGVTAVGAGSNDVESITISSPTINGPWTLTGTFNFSAVGAPHPQEYPALQLSID